MATFIGDYSNKIDSKGRMIFPSAFKKQMKKIRSRINPYNREHNRFLRNFFKGTAELSLDGSNRLLIPKKLLLLVGIEKEVVLAGQDGRIEIWAKDKYEAIDMPVEDFADLAEKLMGGFIPEDE